MPIYEVEVVAHGRINLMVTAKNEEEASDEAYNQVDHLFDKSYRIETSEPREVKDES